MADKPGPVLVTGANSGIGLATTMLLARRGWETWGTVRTKAKAGALSEAAKAADVATLVRPLVLDVSNDRAVVARWPELPDFYAVVNNAGYSELGAVEEVSAKEARAQLDINVVAPAVVSACALPAMRERRCRSDRDGHLDRRASGDHAAQRVVPRLEVCVGGLVGRAAHGGGRFRGQGGDRRAGLLQDRHHRQRRAAEPMCGRPRARRTASRTGGRRGLDLIDRLAPPPNAVARVIVSAIESSRPLRRYLVGADALAIASTHPLIPRSLTDAATRLISGLGGAPTTFS